MKIINIFHTVNYNIYIYKYTMQIYHLIKLFYEEKILNTYQIYKFYIYFTYFRVSKIDTKQNLIKQMH